MDPFRGCGEPDQAEMLLLKATLDEVLRTVPVAPAVLVYNDISDDEPNNADDEIAVYPVSDKPDDDAPDVAPPKVRRVRRPNCCTLPALPSLEGARVYSTSPQQTIARKNLVPDFMLRVAAECAP